MSQFLTYLVSEITTFPFLPLGLPQQFTVAYKEPYNTLTDIRLPGLNQTTQILKNYVVEPKITLDGVYHLNHRHYLLVQRRSTIFRNPLRHVTLFFAHDEHPRPHPNQRIAPQVSLDSI